MINEFSDLVQKIRSANHQIENELKTQDPLLNLIDKKVIIL
jgi:hypothetical protein